MKRLKSYLETIALMFFICLAFVGAFVLLILAINYLQYAIIPLLIIGGTLFACEERYKDYLKEEEREKSNWLR